MIETNAAKTMLEHGFIVESIRLAVDMPALTPYQFAYGATVLYGIANMKGLSYLDTYTNLIQQPYALNFLMTGLDVHPEHQRCMQKQLAVTARRKLSDGYGFSELYSIATILQQHCTQEALHKALGEDADASYFGIQLKYVRKAAFEFVPPTSGLDDDRKLRSIILNLCPRLKGTYTDDGEMMAHLTNVRDEAVVLDVLRSTPDHIQNVLISLNVPNSVKEEPS